MYVSVFSSFFIHLAMSLAYVHFAYVHTLRIYTFCVSIRMCIYLLLHPLGHDLGISLLVLGLLLDLLVTRIKVKPLLPVRLPAFVYV